VKNRSCLEGKVETNASGKDIRKVCRRVNMVQILSTHECKWKKRYMLKLFQDWVKKGIEENGRGGEFNYDIFDIVRTFVNATKSP
jgi:hypothetical protein